MEKDWSLLVSLIELVLSFKDVTNYTYFYNKLLYLYKYLPAIEDLDNIENLKSFKV